MVDFQINLIRRRVIPPKRRQMLFWGMAVYLGICGVALVAVAHQSTKRFLGAASDRREVVRLESRFQEIRPGQEDMAMYASVLKGELTRYSWKLDAIDEILGNRMDFSEVLLGLATPLPYDVHIIHMAFDGEKKSLTFDVVVPANPSGNNLSARQLLALWHEDESLMSRMGHIKLVIRQRQNIEGTPVFILRFTGKPTSEEA